MPKQTQTSKEDVINVGMQIVRETGIDSVNARAIAKVLNTSVHPIFHHFKNMEELKKTLYDKGVEVYKEYMERGVNGDYSYRSIGINYIKLAREEPHIFQMLFMNKTNMTLDDFMNNDNAYSYIENVISKEVKINREEILSFHKKMWFFTHGIATLVTNKTCILTDKEINELLVEEFFALLKLQEFKQSKEWSEIINYLNTQS